MTLEILDAKDALVRRYSSADVPPAMDLAKLGTAPEWFTTPSTLSATPGMHRFVWPLRYPAPAGVGGRRGGGGGGPFADGVWAPPGNYKVVLTVNGQQLTQPLTVVPDPRIKLPATAYADSSRSRAKSNRRAPRSPPRWRSRGIRETNRHHRGAEEPRHEGVRHDHRRRIHRPAAAGIVAPLHQSGAGETRERDRQRRRRANRRRPRKLGASQTARPMRRSRLGRA